MDRVLITEAQKADVAALTGLDVEALVECSSMALTQLSKREGIAASKKCVPLEVVWRLKLIALPLAYRINNAVYKKRLIDNMCL